MKLDMDAWHFKVLLDKHKRTIVDKGGDSLCLYFWKVVLGCLCILGLALCAMLLTGLSLFAIYFIGYVYYFMVAEFFGATGFDIEFLTQSIILNIIILGLAFLYYTFDNIGCLYNWYKYKPRTHKEPTLIGSYIRAKKDRVCPFIKLEYGDNE